MEATTPVQTLPAAAPAAPRPVFEVEGLHIDYTTELGVLHAVRNVSLAVHEHESFGLVGESGSGKSTLAMGAIRYLASNGKVTEGSVRLSGVELLGLSPRELRELWGSRIGVVYQSPLSALNPSIVIGKQLADHDRRVQGAQRALVDHADARPPQLAQLARRQAEQLDAAQTHAALGHLAVGGKVADGAHGERGLARAGLADEPEALVLVHGERDVAHRVEHAQLGGVVDVQALDLEDGARRGGRGGGQRLHGSRRLHLSSSRRRAASPGAARPT